MFSVSVVIGGFQCAQPGHLPDFQKTHADAQTGDEKEEVSGDTWTYGNPTNTKCYVHSSCVVFIAFNCHQLNNRLWTLLNTFS